MKQVGLEKVYRYLFILIVIILAYLSFLIAKPYLTAIIGAIVLSYISYPVYEFLARKLRNKNIAAFLMVVLILIVIIIPMIFFANLLIQEAVQLKRSIDIEKILSPFIDSEVGGYLNSIVKSGAEFVLIKGSDFILSIPGKILSFLVMLFVLFYAFKEGKELVIRVEKNIPLDKERKELILREFNDVTYAVIYGFLLTGVIEGIVGGFIFYLFGVNNFILWGLVMMLLAMLPAVGASLVYVPAGLLRLLMGDIFSGIGILVSGFLIISSIETFLRPKIIGRKSKVHPAVIFIGILGGISVFGFIGVIVGPLVVAILIALIKSYGFGKK